MEFTNNSPLVSIVMPVYNGELYLLECINSIRQQSINCWELIFINDGSTDNTLEIIKQFEYFDSRIRIFDFPTNKGLSECLNFGIQLAKGKYIARMDADDVMQPDRLKRQLDFLELNENYGLVASNLELINAEGLTIGEISCPNSDTEIKKMLLKRNPFAHPSVMMRKTLLMNFGNIYSKKFPHCEDYELWIRLSTKTKFYCLPEKLLRYRMHSMQITSSKSRKVNFDVLRLKLFSIIRGNLPLWAIIYLYIPLAHLIIPNSILKLLKK